MARHARHHRLVVANDNSPSGKQVLITFAPLNERSMRTAAEVFLQLIDGRLSGANDN